METLSSFDMISAGLIIFSGVFAYYRGFIKEVLLILNWFLAIVVAYLISPRIFTTISEIDFVMSILGDSCELMMILSFILGFTLALIAISFITYRISYFIETSILNEANKIASDIGYPVLVRPSYVLGGRAMEIAYNEKHLESFTKKALEASSNNIILVDQYLENATEVDVDIIRDSRGKIFVAGIMEHIEEAGIHSGDSACSLPPFSIAKEILLLLSLE